MCETICCDNCKFGGDKYQFCNCKDSFLKNPITGTYSDRIKCVELNKDFNCKHFIETPKSCCALCIYARVPKNDIQSCADYDSGLVDKCRLL